MTRLLALAAAIAASLLIPATALASTQDSRSAFWRLDDVAGVGAADASVNQVANPSFENSTSGWITSGGFLTGSATLTPQTDSAAPVGGYVGKVATTASSAAGIGTDVSLVGGRRYEVHVKLKRDTGGSNLRIALGQVAAPNEELVVNASATPSSTSYSEFTGTVTPSSTGSYRLYVRTTNAIVTTFYADAMTVQEKPELVSNTSFESSTSGWITSGGFLTGSATLARQSDTGAPDGGAVGKVSTTASSAAGIGTDVSLVGGRRYRVRVKIKRDAGSNLRIALGQVAAPNEELVVNASATPSSTSYSEFTGTVTPSSTGSYRLYVRTTNAIITTFYVDAASVQEEPQLVSNTSFESGTSGWITSGGFLTGSATLARQSDTSAPDGGSVGKVSTTASSAAGIGTDVSLIGGRRYRVRVKLKRDVGGSNLRIALGQVAAPNEELVVNASAAPGSTGYTEYTGTVTPTSTGSYRFYVRTTNAIMTTFYVDAASVAEGNPGTYKGGFTLDRPGATPDGDRAVDLDGSSGYVDLPYVLDPTQAFSIEAWVELDATGMSQDRAIVSQRDGSGTGRSLLYYSALTGTFVSNLGGAGLDSGVRAEAGRFHHLVFTYAGGTDGTWALYVDGVVGNAGIVTGEAANGGLQIGVDKTRSLQFWDGAIDDVAVYSRALSPDEIPQIAPPTTSIDSGPSGETANASPSFAYSSNESGAGFECKLTPVDSDWTACNTSPKSYASLAPGTYTFNVRAKDGSGLTDASPATRTFTVVKCDKIADPPGTPGATITTPGGLDSALASGETGCFHAGTYEQTSVNLNSTGTTFRPYPGESVTWRGRIVTKGSDITLRGLHLDGSYGTRCANDSGCSGNNSCFDPTKCTLPSPTIGGLRTKLIGNDISNQNPTDTLNAGICVNESNDAASDETGYLIQGNRIHNCGEIDATGAPTNHDHGIYVGGGNATSGTIDNNVVYDNADRGIQLYPAAEHVTITHNTLDDNGSGLHFGGKYSKPGPYSDNNTATDNVVTRSRTSGRQNLEYFDLPTPADTGTTPSTNNAVNGVCLWNTGSGNVESGFTQRVALTGEVDIASTPYANSVEGDYTITSSSPCGTMGASGAVTQPIP